MDKYEYNLRIEQIKTLAAEGNYTAAAEMADKVNWERVRNVSSLLNVGDIYERAGRLEDARDLLLLAYDRSPIGRKIIYRLAEIALELKDLDSAHEYYDEFVEIAPNDNLKYAIWYRIRKAEGAKLSEQISILEEYKDQDYTEQWAYELAYLYYKAGMNDECAETCDELILWFGEGEYVEKALELKMKIKPLTRSQEEKYRSYRMMQEGITQIDEETMSRAGEFAHGAVSIPEVNETAGKFDTATLQREIAIGIQQIMDATEEGTVAETMSNIKRLAGEIPYLQVMKKHTQTEEIPIHIESDEEIDRSLRTDFQEMLAEEQDGQISLVTEPQKKPDTQITGQLSIQDVLDSWEKTMRKAEAAMEAADRKKLESAKARAISEAEDLMQRLTGVIPMLEAGHTPESLMRERIMSGDDSEVIPEPAIMLEQPIEFVPEQDMEIELPEFAGAAESKLQEPVAVDELDIELSEFAGAAESKLQEPVAVDELDIELPELAGEAESGLEEPITADELDIELPELAGEAESGLEEPIAAYDLDIVLPELAGDAESGPEEPIAAEEIVEIKVPEMAEETDTEYTEIEIMMNENEEILVTEEVLPEIELELEETEAVEEAAAEAAVEVSKEPAGEEELSAMISEIEEEIKAGTPSRGTSNLSQTTRIFPKGMNPDEDVVGKAMTAIKAASEKKTGARLKTAPLFMTSPATGMKDTTIMPQIDDDREFEVVDEIPADAGYSINDSLLTQETRVISRPADDDLEMEGAETETPAVDEVAAVKKQHTVPFAFSKAQLSQITGETGDIEVDSRMHISELTKEMKSAFSYFVPIRGMEDQLCDAINDISDRLTSSVPVVGGNLIISGEAGCGKTVLATSFIKVLQGYCGRPNGKIGKINASALIKKNVQQVFEKVSGGCLIVENAGNLDRNTAESLAFLMDCDSNGTLVILEDTIPGIKLALSLNEGLAKKFSSKINVPLFTNDELVTFARTYAKELGYKIDDLAILALHNRISNIQRLDQATTLAEVKDIVDEAIERESHFGVFKYFSLVTGKRYTKDDRILLTERNFTK